MMFSAKYFTYDGIHSSMYGLIIAKIGGEAVSETNAFSSVLNTYKPPHFNRFFHTGIYYQSPPQYQFSIMSEKPLNDELRRRILTWLVGGSQFRRLKIHQTELEQYYYNCVFTDVGIIEVNGYCHGFNLTANFDSHFQYGLPIVMSITGTGIAQTVTLNNKSDIYDNYIYPKVEFKSTAPVGDKAIQIINQTDNPDRAFAFTTTSATETVTIENDIKYIKSSTGDDRFSSFNKNWLRLRQGINTLNITINGTVTITCPTYAMMGF